MKLKPIETKSKYNLEQIESLKGVSDQLKEILNQMMELNPYLRPSAKEIC